MDRKWHVSTAKLFFIPRWSSISLLNVNWQSSEYEVSTGIYWRCFILYWGMYFWVVFRSSTCRRGILVLLTLDVSKRTHNENRTMRREAGGTVCKNNTIYIAGAPSSFTIDYILFKTKNISQIIVENTFLLTTGELS